MSKAFGLYCTLLDRVRFNPVVVNELTVGDITAVTIFQAALPAPGPVRSSHAARRLAAARGRKLFEEIGCGGCHRPTLILASSQFSEPNPFNLPGNLQAGDVAMHIEFELATGPRGAHFDNEQVPQGSLVGFADPADFTVLNDDQRPTSEFLTRKLWDAGNSDPYGHRGDLTTLTEAIHFHGGDARAERDAFFRSPRDSETPS